ncbi:hypothetical protein F53441_8101 [Fusarium austroafricanum]|uniref:Heterokaryon incompatibility domain-containing protein n=1 Tax=Fusarium austroafricanum TaxID=2364996 RepID=A0A8H4NUT2_9HYPO|nr:hypothetical protein F53441_8101 [Fusarium austroafricanum]
MAFDTSNHHIAIVAPLPSDYSTARALLDDPFPEYLLAPSKASCMLGKIGPHNVVLVGNAENPLNVSIFVKNAVVDLLREYSSIRAGFLLGIDAEAPNDGIARAGDIVVGVPYGPQPGLVQFDAEKTSACGRLSATYQFSGPPSCIASALHTLKSPSGQQEWEQCEDSRLKEMPSSRLDLGTPTKIVYGKIASFAQSLSREENIHKIGKESNIACFERAAANLESQLPFLAVCGVSTTSDSSPERTSTERCTRTAAVIYVIFLASKVEACHLRREHPFVDLFGHEAFDLERPGFRLLRLEQGSESHVKCHLFQGYLDDEENIIPYEALSYVWSDPFTGEEIKVGEKSKAITTSLYEALYHLRQPDEDRVLWVDALCIDQSNIKERGHQVNQMGEIYKKANSVIIWLGYLTSDAILLHSAVRDFEKQLPPEAFRQWPQGSFRWKDQWDAVETSLGSFSHERLINGLKDFTNHPWFTRVWILQEAANAKRAKVKSTAGEIPTKIFTILPHVLGVQRSSSWWNKYRNLGTLLWKFRGCQATDPRDRIYALLGMASDLKEDTIKPGYSKEEKTALADLCRYLFEDEWPFDSPFPSSIQKFQSEFNERSRELLLRKLGHERAALTRRLPLSEVGNQAILDMAQTKGSDFRRLVEKLGASTIAAPRFVAEAMQRNLSILQQFVKASENPVEFEEQVLLETFSSGLEATQCFFGQCSQSFNVTKTPLMKALKFDPAILDYLLSKLQDRFELEEDLFLMVINERPDTLHRFLMFCNYPVYITEPIKEAAIRKQVPLEEKILTSWTSNLEETESVIREAMQTGPMALKYLIYATEDKFQITDRIVMEAKDTDCYGIILVIRYHEVDIRESVQLRAVQSGPKVLTGLMNQRKTNFRAMGHFAAAARKRKDKLEILRSKRHSKVFPNEPDTYLDVSERAYQGFESTVKQGSAVHSQWFKDQGGLSIPEDGVRLLSFLWFMPGDHFQVVIDPVSLGRSYPTSLDEEINGWLEGIRLHTPTP